MKMSIEDYEERLARRAEGVATDDDLRLIKHYEREGYTNSGRADGAWLFEGDDSSATADGGADSDGYETLSYRDLQAKCRDAELLATGTQDDLIVRLREHDAAVRAVTGGK